MSTSADIAETLRTVKPLRLEGIELLVRLHQGPPAHEVLASFDQISQAQEELGAHAERTKEVVRRCCCLPPVPSRHTIPIGI